MTGVYSIYAEGGYLVFYRNSKGELLFANVSSVTKEQSVGLVMDMKTREEKKTSSTYQRDIIQFKWLYANTYDNKTGVANITIRKTYEPKNVYFIMKMVLSNRDEIIYKGYFKDKDFDEDYIP